MNEEELKKMIDDTYDVTKEDTLRSMIKDFYNRKMTSVVITIWCLAIVFLSLCVFSSMKFFATDDVKSLIMYAVIFICAVQYITLLKSFAWKMIHRNAIKREIKRLELKIAQLTQVIEVSRKD